MDFTFLIYFVTGIIGGYSVFQILIKAGGWVQRKAKQHKGVDSIHHMGKWLRCSTKPKDTASWQKNSYDMSRVTGLD